MASDITHFIVGAALSLPALESPAIRRILPAWAIPVSCGAIAVLPDFDVPAMHFLHHPYAGFLGHRGFFHSPFFLILLASAVAAIVARRHPPRAFLLLALLWVVCAVTHPLLDALTDGGDGVMLLFPFSTRRLFFPWRPIRVSPLSIRSFFAVADYILRLEVPFCAAAIVIGLAGWWFARAARRRHLLERS